MCILTLTVSVESEKSELCNCGGVSALYDRGSQHDDFSAVVPGQRGAVIAVIVIPPVYD